MKHLITAARCSLSFLFFYVFVFPTSVHFFKVKKFHKLAIKFFFYHTLELKKNFFKEILIYVAAKIQHKFIEFRYNFIIFNKKYAFYQINVKQYLSQIAVIEKKISIF